MIEQIGRPVDHSKLKSTLGNPEYIVYNIHLYDGDNYDICFLRDGQWLIAYISTLDGYNFNITSQRSIGYSDMIIVLGSNLMSNAIKARYDTPMFSLLDDNEEDLGHIEFSGQALERLKDNFPDIYIYYKSYNRKRDRLIEMLKEKGII